jgi:hypothetical protein
MVFHTPEAGLIDDFFFTFFLEYYQKKLLNISLSIFSRIKIHAFNGMNRAEQKIFNNSWDFPACLLRDHEVQEEFPTRTRKLYCS